MKLSIIVPAYNAEDTVARCLTALCTVVGERQDCEIIVVDDGSTDRTPDIARQFPVRVLRCEPNVGRIRAREAGARAAQADTLLFVDARVLVPPDALHILDTLAYEPVMGGTAALNVSDGTALDRFLFLLRQRIYAPYYPQAETFPVLWITPQHFDRVPKGMGFFAIHKTRSSTVGSSSGSSAPRCACRVAVAGSTFVQTLPLPGRWRFSRRSSGSCIRSTRRP